MKTKSKIIAGAVVALALGVAASVFLSSKKGKALTKNAKETVADFYRNVSPQLKKISKMGKEEYMDFMESAVEKYSQAKKLSKETVKELKSQVQKSWKHFAQNIK